MNKNLFTLLVLSSFVSAPAIAHDLPDITQHVIDALKDKNFYHNHGDTLGVVDGLILNNGKTLENSGHWDTHNKTRKQGVAKNTIVNEGGKLTSSGTAKNTTINAGGTMKVTSHDLKTNTTFTDYGYADGITLNGEQKKMASLQVLHGSRASNLVLNGFSGMTVQTVGKEKQQSKVTNVTLNNTSFASVYDDSLIEDATLNEAAVVQLFGGSQALGELNVKDKGQVWLYTDGTSATSKRYVSGAVADNIHLTSKDSRIIINQSSNSIENSAHIKNLITQGTTWLKYVEGADAFINLNIDNLEGNGLFVLNVDGMKGDHITVTQSIQGKHNLRVIDSGKENLNSNGYELIHAMGGNNENFKLERGAVDLGAYLHYLNYKEGEKEGEYHWYLTDENPNPTPEPAPEAEKPPIPQTTPSVDAALSMASVAQFIFEGELQNLRLRRGALADNASSDDVNVWGRYLNNKMRVTGTENAAYRLKQSGMELGVDKLYGFEQGRLSVGVSAATSSNRVTHARGGDSNVSSYSASLYATYLANNGLYVDGVIKTAQFNNRLNARMTGGSHAQAKYNQFGIGGSLESGYRYQFGHEDIKHFIEPYLRASYLTTSAKNFTMNNAMDVALERQQSLRGEVGVNLGTAFKLTNHSTLRPYIKAAFEHELIKHNDVHINNKHSFNNELAGSRGKYGAGLDLTIGNNAAIYTELNYINGSKVESPIVANLGFRFNF